MEREAFRQRMQQYKQARENNPQLKYWDWKKENDLGYQLYKNNLPSNLQVETDDYDLYGAYESNMQPELNEDGTYHLGSRDPYTGRILKSKQHPTYQKAIESEMSAGYFPYEKNNVTYTKTYSPVDISGYADGGEVKDNTYVAPIYKEQTFIPATGATKVRNDYQYNYGSKSPYKGGELEIVSPEFDIITGVRGVLNSIPSNALKPTTNVVDELNNQFIKRQMQFGKNSGRVIHADYGDAQSGFTAGTTGATVTKQGLKPGHNPNTEIDYTWWNADKPYSYSINNKPFTRYMSADEKDIPGILTVRDQTTPIGQWNGKSGFVLKSEKVTPDIVPMQNIETYQYDPLIRTYGRVEYGNYAEGGTIDEDPPQNTSERPITNFDPKGDPYNPTYGYNPGAGYVSNLDPLGSLYVEGALLNPVFKLAGNAVSNIARGLTKYSSKYVPEVRRTVQDKINSLFRREAEDKARTYKLYDDAIESRNRIIEDLYSNPAYMERARQIKKAIRSLPKDMRSIEAAYLQFATPGQYTKWFNKIPLLGTYPIVNK